jgi:endonuclease III
MPSKLAQILEILEKAYGPQKLAGPSDPYEMLVFLNCGYPASDGACAKGFDALKREVGVEPNKLLAASKAKLTKLMRPSVIVPAVCAQRLRAIAGRVKTELHGDLTAALEKRIEEAKGKPGNDFTENNLKPAKKVLQEFPTIGEPSAEKILLFSGLAPVAAVPSAFVDVPMRLFVGEPGKNYAANYRTARGILDAGLPKTFAARQRAYLLLKKHGQEICKRSKPKCESCPLTAHCAYLQAQAADSNIGGNLPGDQMGTKNRGSRGSARLP